MLKVANILEEGRFGGPQAWISIVSSKLTQYGVETIVVFPKNNSSFFYKKLYQAKIRFHQITLHRLTKFKIHLLKYIILFIPEVISLYRLIKKENIDVVHCNNSWQIKGLLASKLANKPTVWTIHESYMPNFINFIFNFFAVRFCDIIVVAGERVRTRYLMDKKFSIKKIIVCQSPVDTSIFNPPNVCEDLKISQFRGTKIIMVANISPVKGIEHFIEMGKILNRKYNELNFFIAGSQLDSQKKYKKKIFSEVVKNGLNNIHFLGPLENIPSVLKASDIYVCSSIAEASPISIWEAMAMSMPIVSTDVGDVSRFIDNGKSGFVVPVKDSEALADKVALLIDNPELRKSFGQSARAVAVKLLDIDICVKKHAQFYKEVMDNS